MDTTQPVDNAGSPVRTIAAIGYANGMLPWSAPDGTCSASTQGSMAAPHLIMGPVPTLVDADRLDAVTAPPSGWTTSSAPYDVHDRPSRQGRPRTTVQKPGTRTVPPLGDGGAWEG